jgi:hypothetical protein
VDVDGRAGSYLLARGALVAGLFNGALNAVERLGENPRYRGFPDSPFSGKQKGMGNSAFLDGILERPGYVFLSDDILKGLGTASAGEHLVWHDKTLPDLYLTVGC